MKDVVRIEVDKAIADKAKPLLKRSGLTITSYIRVQLLDFIGGIETPIKKVEQSDNELSDLL
jgi:antitoxin component of RelBE/YafQ-DinJ toxin-antitoxin module